MKRKEYHNMTALSRLKTARQLMKGINTIENDITLKETMAIEEALKGPERRLDTIVHKAIREDGR